MSQDLIQAAIQRVGVIGAGQMGSGIAEVAVRAGVDVTVFETTEALITAGRNRIVKSLERGVSAGKVTERERDRALDQLTFTTELKDLADRQLVIEAVVEDEAVKAQIFAGLDEVITDPDAVLAALRRYYTTARGVAASIIHGTPIAQLTEQIDTMHRAQVAFLGDLSSATSPDRKRLADAFAAARATHREVLTVDIIVAAAGAPELVKGYWVKPGAVIIDVGITRLKDDDGKTRLVGDVAFDEVQHARAVTPVPGGVGPMTIACLLANTVQTAREQVDGTGTDSFAIEWDDLPDRSMIFGEKEAAPPA